MPGSRSRSPSSSALIHCRSCGSGWAPWNASTGWPPAIAMTIGIDWTWNSCAMRGLASTSTLASTQLPLPSAASFSSTGESCLHGPHQSAHRSTTTGTCMDRSITSDWKVDSVTSTTAAAEPCDPWAAPSAAGCWALCGAEFCALFLSEDRSTAPAIAAGMAAFWRGSGLVTSPS